VAAIWFKIVDRHIQDRCYQANDETIKAENKQAAAPKVSGPGAHHSLLFGGLLVDLRVRMQPQTMNAITIAKKIPSSICCIVVFSVA
jgi:hypothetical protein